MAGPFRQWAEFIFGEPNTPNPDTNLDNFHNIKRDDVLTDGGFLAVDKIIAHAKVLVEKGGSTLVPGTELIYAAPDFTLHISKETLEDGSFAKGLATGTIEWHVSGAIVDGSIIVGAELGLAAAPFIGPEAVPAGVTGPRKIEPKMSRDFRRIKKRRSRNEEVTVYRGTDRQSA